jgi:hypothetical protein
MLSTINTPLVAGGMAQEKDMSLTKVKALRGFRASIDNVFRDVKAGEVVSLPDLLAISVISSNKAQRYINESSSPDKDETDEPSKRRGQHAR